MGAILKTLGKEAGKIVIVIATEEGARAALKKLKKMLKG